MSDLTNAVPVDADNTGGLEVFSVRPIQKDSSPQPQASTTSDAVVADQSEASNASDELWPEGHPSERFGANNQNPTQAQANLPKKDQSRFEYWQSEATKAQNELAAKDAKLAELEALAAVGRSVLEGKASPQASAPKQAPPSAEPAKVAETTLEIPKAPQKPERYDEVEAYNDPQSESYKYRKQYERYRDDMMTYFVTKQEVKEKAEVAEREAKSREESMKRSMVALQGQLQAQFGLSSSEAVDFIQTMTDPSAVTLDALVTLYRLKKSPKQPNRSADMRQRNERLNAPLPGGVAGGEGNSPESDEAMFNRSLLTHSRRTQRRGIA